MPRRGRPAVTGEAEPALEAASPDQVVRRVAIDGIVVDQEGAGVAGSWVAIVRDAAMRDGVYDRLKMLELVSDPPAPVAETRADEHGRFRLDLPAGSRDAIASTAPGSSRVCRIAVFPLLSSQ